MALRQTSNTQERTQLSVQRALEERRAQEQQQAAQQAAYEKQQAEQAYFQQHGMTQEQAMGLLDFEPWDWGGITAESLAHGAQQAEQQRRAALQAQVTQQQTAQANDRRFGSDMSWLDPAFQQNPALLGQSQAAQAQADPATIAAQQNAYSGMSSLANTPMNWQSPAQQQGMFDQWGQVAAGQGAPQFQGSGQQQGILNQMSALQAPNWSGSGNLQGQTFNEIGSSYNPQYRSEADQVGAMNALRGNNSGQQQQWLNAIGANNSGQQNQALGQLQSNNSGQQQGVFNDLTALYNSGGTQGLDWDDGSRQATQYGHLQEIIDGGGATKIEMANRQAQRADQEQWLRSQREADMQDYAERGLTGSGQELLALQADRQAAGSRNSLADLQTAAQLEQRRTDAIGTSANLAGQMRGQTYQEQALEAQRADASLYARGDMANSIRGMDLQRDIAAGDLTSQIRGMDLQRDVSGGQLSSQIRGMDLQRDQAVGDMANALRSSTMNEQNFLAQNSLQKAMARSDLATNMRGQNFNEQSFNAQYGLDQARAMGDLSGQMRGQTFNENSYLDTRKTNAMAQQTDLANQLRANQFQEQSFARNNQTDLYGQMGNLGTNMRNASFNESYQRGTSADQFARYNQDAINSAQQGNVGFLQDAYMQTQRQRQQWEMNALNQKIQAGIQLTEQDFREQQYGYSQATQLGTSDANTYNNAKDNRNAAYGAANGLTWEQQRQAELAKNAAVTQVLPAYGNFLDTAVTGSTGMPTGGGGGGGGLSQSGTTWAGGGGGGGGTLDSVIGGANNFASYDPWNSQKKAY